MTVVLRGVNRIRYRAADGEQRFYYYHRRSGIKLPGQPASPEFVAMLDKLNRGMGPKRAPPEGSIDALVADYKASPKFTQLAEKTRRDYLRYLGLIQEAWGPLGAAGVTTVHVDALQEQFAATPRTANYVVQVVRILMAIARRKGLRKDNPAEKPGMLRTGDGHRPAEEAEIAQFRRRWKPETLERVCFELVLNVGQRGGDSIATTRPHYRRGWISARPEKTKRSSGIRIDVPASKDLREVLDPYLKTHDQMTLVVTPAGRPFKVDFFRHFMRAAYDAAGLPADFTTHGLRYAAATRLHELGVSWDDIGAIVGHTTAAMVRKYTEQRRRTRLAITKLNRATRSPK